MIANTLARFVAERRALSAAVATALAAAGITAAFAASAPPSGRPVAVATAAATPTPTPTPTAAVKQPHARHSSQPRCFGAAARDPEQPCHNPRLRLMVVPTPRRAETLENP